MNESVRQLKRPWLAGAALVIVAAAYFFLLGSSRYPEPGPNIEYNIQAFEDLDKIETQFEEKGSISLNVENPRALAVGQGKIYVAGKDSVVVFGENDQETARFSVEGTPNCVAAASDGTVYAGMPRRVVVLDDHGALQSEWSNDFVSRSYLTSIAVNGSDVYVADAGKRVVYRFDRKGALQTRIGEKDASRDVPGIEAPSPYLDLAVNNDGELWVVNPGKLGLEQYRSDGSIVTSWYRPSLKLDGFPGCCNPTHIAFNSKGELITCEKGLVRVKKYEVTSGDFEGLVAGSKLFPQEQSLRDIAVDSRDRILALDAQRNAVRVFTRKESSPQLSNQRHGSLDGKRYISRTVHTGDELEENDHGFTG
ncbi:MAG: NHL repeat-containing protein [Candidatus Hydrogenedentes bacterium]|nr:NHL repeat-containing protein [Candidatus Hydrogenedentota bacterium]